MILLRKKGLQRQEQPDYFKNRDPSRDKVIVRPDGANVFYRFRGEFGVLTMENRGHWHSNLGESTPKTYLNDMADDLAAIVRKCGLYRVVVCGQSMWGGNAMRFFHRHPDMVSGLILVAPAFMDPRKLGFMNGHPLVQRFSALLTETAGKMSKLDMLKTKVLSRSKLAWEAMRFAMLMTFMRETDNPEHAEKMIKNVYRADAKAMVMSMQALFLMDDSLFDRAPEIDVPTLLIAGSEDPLISHHSVEHLARQIPGANFELFPGCAHFPMLSAVDEFNESVYRFMKVVA